MLFLGLMQFFERIVLFLLELAHCVFSFRRLLDIGNESVAILEPSSSFLRLTCLKSFGFLFSNLRQILDGSFYVLLVGFGFFLDLLFHLFDDLR